MSSVRRRCHSKRESSRHSQSFHKVRAKLHLIYVLIYLISDLVQHWSPLAKYHKSQRLAVVASLCHTYAKLDKLSLSDMTRTLLKAGCNRPACLHAFCESHRCVRLDIFCVLHLTCQFAALISTPTPDRREAFIFALRSLPRKARLPTNALTTADIEKTRAKTTPCGHECFLYRGSETDVRVITRGGTELLRFYRPTISFGSRPQRRILHSRSQSVRTWDLAISLPSWQSRAAK